MTHLFIINPLSVSGKKLAVLCERITQTCQARNVPYEIYVTKEKGDASRYACERLQTGERIRLYACGGDGTVGELAAVAGTFENAELSVLPYGTGNDFIRNFSTKKQFLNIDALLDATVHTVDLLQWNDHICANMINIGFDRSVVSRVAKLRRYPLMTKSIAYTIGVIMELFRFPKETLHITLPDGQEYKGRLLLMLAANGQYCGGGYRAAAKAALDDGLMDVMIIQPISRLTFLSLVGSYKNGTLLENPRAKGLFQHFQTDTLTIQKDTPFEICCDGELHTVSKLTLRCLPDALRFAAPVQSKTRSAKKSTAKI